MTLTTHARRSPLLRGAALIIIIAAAAPIVAVIIGALNAGNNALSSAAIIDYVSQTISYAGITLALAIGIALPAAWLTVMRRFVGDKNNRVGPC